MKSLLWAPLFLLILCLPGIADDTIIVKELVETRLDSALLILGQKDLTDNAKKDRITELVKPIFNFPLMARLTLKKYWKTLPKEKQKRFIDLFTKRMQEMYLDKLTLYTNEEVVCNDPVQLGQKKIHVPTELISKGNTISIIYKFYYSKQDWKVYDLEIQGVSIVSTYRSQFDQVMRKGTIDDLCLNLEGKALAETNNE
ncbi:MAG: ABC transporter substrate-binding protein [Desulfobacterales bacterium]|nr:ABC transporter substrate-binding protein [Desulfobacterales bacterium]